LLLGIGRTDARLSGAATGGFLDRTFLNLSPTADHRIIDGLSACEVSMASAAHLPILITPSSIEASLNRTFLRLYPDAIIEKAQSGPQQAVDRDGALLEAMFSKQSCGTRIRLWTNTPCVVLPYNQVKDKSLDRASEAAAARGYAVALRRTGGSAVIHRPGILCISLLETTVVDQARRGNLYAPLLDIICSILKELGIESEYGNVADSYCDGKYNVRVGSRKIAGTAALVRGRNGMQGSLVHAALSVWGDLSADIAAVSAVECALGFPASYSANAHTSVLAELNSLPG